MLIPPSIPAKGYHGHHSKTSTGYWSHRCPIWTLGAFYRTIVGATSKFVHLEKFSLNFSSLSFVIRVNHSSPSLTTLVPSWSVYYYFVSVFPLYQTNILWFPSR